MSTLDRIKAVLDKYNTTNNHQVNFGSDCMRQWIAEDVYDAVMKQSDGPASATYYETPTDTQMVFFSNLEDKENK